MSTQACQTLYVHLCVLSFVITSHTASCSSARHLSNTALTRLHTTILVRTQCFMITDAEALEEAISRGLPHLRSDIKRATAGGTWSVEQLIGLRAALVRTTTATCASFVNSSSSANSSSYSSGGGGSGSSSSALAVAPQQLNYVRIIDTVLQALRKHVAAAAADVVQQPGVSKSGKGKAKQQLPQQQQQQQQQQFDAQLF
jgi:hypothetical protein